MWTIRIERRAEKELSRLPKSTQKRIVDFLEHKVATRENPRELGAALTGPFAGLWKYRVGDFRIIARIQDQHVTIVVVTVGDRREVYR